MAIAVRRVATINRPRQEVYDCWRRLDNLPRFMTHLKIVVPFPISHGHCFFCQRQLFSLCDNSNPNAWMAEKLYGYSPAGI